MAAVVRSATGAKAPAKTEAANGNRGAGEPSATREMLPATHATDRMEPGGREGGEPTASQRETMGSNETLTERCGTQPLQRRREAKGQRQREKEEEEGPRPCGDEEVA